MGAMFIKTRDKHTATELIAAGFQLFHIRDDWYIFGDVPNFKFTEEQRSNIIRTPLIYM